MHWQPYLLSFIVFFLGITSPDSQLMAENAPSNWKSLYKVEGNSLFLFSDTTSHENHHHEGDSLTSTTDSSLVQRKKDIQTTVFYSAEDTQIMNIIDRTVYLKGEAKIEYGDLTLEAEEIFLDWKTNTVYAYGAEDSTGAKYGLPVFNQGGTVYNAEEIEYNFDTEKGKIKRIITEQGDGYLIGETVRKTPSNELFIKNAVYTTCNLEHPHYAIKINKVKAIPKKSVIAGPFYTTFSDVPTPLMFFFGIFPVSDQRTSGIIIPNYGEARDRGFYLRDGGFFFAISGYVGLTLTGEIYSLGGWGMKINNDYRYRYHFNGNLNFRYNNVVRQNADLSRTVTNDYWISWNHSPLSKKSSRFSASINFGSSTYNQNNSYNLNNATRSNFTSNVSYSKTFKGTPFSFSSAIRQSQNVTTNIVETSPTASLAMSRINPFKKKGSTKKNLLTKTNLSYNAQYSGIVSNNPSKIAVNFSDLGVDDDKLIYNSKELAERQAFAEELAEKEEPEDYFGNIATYAKYGQHSLTHTIPVSTNLTFLKYFNLSPGFSYNAFTYDKEYTYTYNETDSTLSIDTKNGLFIGSEYGMNSSLSTRLYQFFYLPGENAIRHMMTPSVSYNYSPDFKQVEHGYYQNVQTGPDPEKDTKLISKYRPYGNRVPGSGLSHSMSFSLRNQLELKYKNKKDTTGKEPYKKVPLLENFSISSGYNFVENTLSDIRLSANTKISKFVTITGGATITPYEYVLYSYDPADGSSPTSRASAVQEKTDRFAWDAGHGLGSLKSFNVNTSFKLSPDIFASNKEVTSEEPPEGMTPHQEEQWRDIQENPGAYVDFKVPWSMSVSHIYSISKTGYGGESITHAVTFRGDLKITEKWKIGYNSGWDFIQDEMKVTTLSIFRDLHCWQMSLSWTPFGARTGYDMEIGVKAPLLRDLKVQKRNSWYDRR